MSKRTPPPVTTTTPIGRDVDLDTEDVRLADGSRLTELAVAEMVEAARGLSGRPSLSGQSEPSPQIAFRVPRSVRDRAAELAAQQGISISQLAREALEARVQAS